MAPCSARSTRQRHRSDCKAASASLLGTAPMRSLLNSSSGTGSRSMASQYIRSRSSGESRSN